jgi:hypothetical protein
MPYVSRRTMRIYRRFDHYVLRPLQILCFTATALSIGYLLIGVAVIAMAGTP